MTRVPRDADILERLGAAERTLRGIRSGAILTKPDPRFVGSSGGGGATGGLSIIGPANLDFGDSNGYGFYSSDMSYSINGSDSGFTIRLIIFTISGTVESGNGSTPGLWFQTAEDDSNSWDVTATLGGDDAPKFDGGIDFLASNQNPNFYVQTPDRSFTSLISESASPLAKYKAKPLKEDVGYLTGRAMTAHGVLAVVSS